MGTHVAGAFASCAEHLVNAVSLDGGARPGVHLERGIVDALEARLAAARTPGEAWKLGSGYLLEVDAPFDVHAALYAALATHVEAGLLPAWSPDAAQPCNLSRLMGGLGFANYPALHAWSVAQPDAYWRATIDALNLQFETPTRLLRGAPDVVEEPRWLEGAALNVARACLDGAEQNIALIVRSGELITSYTKAELSHAVERAAAGLRRLGVAAGDHVAMAVPLGIEAVTGYLALLYLGAVVVCVAESYSEQELEVRLQITQPKWVLTADVVRRGGKQLPLYTKFTRVNAPRAIVISGAVANGRTPETAVPLREGDVTWESLTDNLTNSNTVAAFSTPIGATNTVLFSSGTTGTPKAIPWTPACAIKAAADAKWHLDVRSADRLLWPTSLGWMMGAWSIFATLLNGATLVIFDDAPTLRAMGELVESARVTHLGVVPSLVRSFREGRTMEGLDWSHVRVLSSTGECSNPTDMLYLMWLARYRPIVEYCGGTEIAGGYITSTLLDPCVPSCFTTAALGQAFVCLNEAGELAEEGEAFLTTPSLGLSTTLLNKDHHDEYYAGVPRAGWRRHGDLIQKVNDAYYRVLGRADDTMNLGGVKVSSAELERACQDVAGVHELAAIAIAPSGGGPSALVMCVVVTQGKAFDEATLVEQLQRRVCERVNPLFKVERVVAVDSLPRTASNKVMRRVLRSRYVELPAPPKTSAERIVS